jgi:hypothetical protein
MGHPKSFKTPVLFIIYDRADTALHVFDVIKRVCPTDLYIASDGPAGRYPEEKNNVLNLRKDILDSINWECNVWTMFSETNLGPCDGVKSAIDWFFYYVEEGIVLEHDCLPEESFFYFCQELLNKYKNHEEIMHISGSNFLFGKLEIEHSYYCSKYPFIWGWASWKRAWKKYDPILGDLENFFSSETTKSFLNSKIENDYWANIFYLTRKGRFNTWDYQWIYSIWKSRGISLNSSKNLVSNIGYGKGAVNTGYHKTILSNMERVPMERIYHPSSLKKNGAADRISFENYFGEHINNLFDQNENLQRICEERLELINSLVKTADERLGIIEVLESEIKKIRDTN